MYTISQKKLFTLSHRVLYIILVIEERSIRSIMAMVQKYKVQNKYYNICEITGNKDKVHQGLRIFYCKDFKTE